MHREASQPQWNTTVRSGMDKTYRAQVQWQMVWLHEFSFGGSVGIFFFNQQYLATIKMPYPWKISVPPAEDLKLGQSPYICMFCFCPSVSFPHFAFFKTLQTFLMPFSMSIILVRILFFSHVWWVIHHFLDSRCQMKLILGRQRKVLFSGLLEDISTSKSSWKISQTVLFF